MADESAPKEEGPEANTELHADAAAMPQPRPTAWVTGDGHMTFVRPVPRRFELNAAALPVVGDAGEAAPSK